MTCDFRIELSSISQCGKRHFHRASIISAVDATLVAANDHNLYSRLSTTSHSLREEHWRIKDMQSKFSLIKVKVLLASRPGL